MISYVLSSSGLSTADADFFDFAERGVDGIDMYPADMSFLKFLYLFCLFGFVVGLVLQSFPHEVFGPERF